MELSYDALEKRVILYLPLIVLVHDTCSLIYYTACKKNLAYLNKYYIKIKALKRNKLVKNHPMDTLIFYLND